MFACHVVFCAMMFSLFFFFSRSVGGRSPFVTGSSGVTVSPLKGKSGKTKRFTTDVNFGRGFFC